MARWNHHFRTTAQCKQLKQRIKRNWTRWKFAFQHPPSHVLSIVQKRWNFAPIVMRHEFFTPFPINQFSETLENIFHRQASWLMRFRCADDLWLLMFNVLIFWLTDSFAFHLDDNTYELETNFIGFRIIFAQSNVERKDFGWWRKLRLKKTLITALPNFFAIFKVFLGWNFQIFKKFKF